MYLLSSLDKHKPCNYIVTMKANIISIGNSQGIRIPKVLLEQSNLSGEVELEISDEGILIRRAKKNREDWAESFKQMSENNDDETFEDFALTKKIRENWRW